MVKYILKKQLWLYKIGRKNYEQTVADFRNRKTGKIVIIVGT
jgi:hypothetical protein